ncbi:hypothetical protein HDU83_007638 [Entophlyctis luteolus]|nr:hypothetical protein HDU83_007638 [Entophlyctis luteolus]
MAVALAHVSAAAVFAIAGPRNCVDVLLTGVSLAHYLACLSAVAPNSHPPHRSVSRMRLYLFLGASFIVRFLLTEWVFAGFYRTGGGLRRHAVRQCAIMGVFWLHLFAAHDAASRMESSAQTNLDKGHLVAFYIWMKLGSPMGVLSSGIAWMLTLRAVSSRLSPYDAVPLALAIIIFVNIVVFCCSFWKLLLFVKELSLVFRIYGKIPDFEMGFASDTDDDSVKDS